MSWPQFEWLRKKVDSIVSGKITAQTNDLKTSITNNTTTITNSVNNLSSSVNVTADRAKQMGGVMPYGMQHSVLTNEYPALTAIDVAQGQTITDTKVIRDVTFNGLIVPIQIVSTPIFEKDVSMNGSTIPAKVKWRQRVYIYIDNVLVLKVEPGFTTHYHNVIDQSGININLDLNARVVSGLYAEDGTYKPWMSTWFGEKILNYPLLARNHLKVVVARDFLNETAAASGQIIYAFPKINVLYQEGIVVKNNVLNDQRPN